MSRVDLHLPPLGRERVSAEGASGLDRYRFRTNTVPAE